MAFQKFIVPALALAGSALAQSGSCPSDDTFEISSSSDAQQLSNCREFDGDVVITESASGTIQLNGVRSIKGDLRCTNATELTAITSDQLNAIGGIFDLEQLTILSTLQFDSLSEVDSIKWISLPALQSLNFGQGVSKAENVYISDTGLMSLDGIDLEAVDEMDINNNKFMTEVDVNSLSNVTKALTFAANSKDLKISLPNLESAANLTFINTSDVSMPSLAEVGGSMGFLYGTFETFSAPNLTETANDVSFVSCGNLNNISCPSLEKIGGGFVIANNTDLEKIDDFPELTTISGALDFAGVFDEVTFPKLGLISGGAFVQSSTQDESLCDAFKKASDQDIIRGTTRCETNQENSKTNGSTTEGGSSSSSSSSAADPSIFDPSAPLTGLSAIIAAILFI